MSYNEQRELEALPARIEALEAEERRVNAAVAGPDFYKEPPDHITRTVARVESVHVELVNALARWDELDSRSQ